MLKVLDTAMIVQEPITQNGETTRFPETPAIVFEDKAGNAYNVLTDIDTYTSVKEILSQLDDVESSVKAS